MGVTPRIRPAVPEDVEILAPNLRKADIREIYAAFGLVPKEALITSLELSTHAWAGEIDGELICLFGVGPTSMLTGDGSPWMVGTDKIEKHAILFLRFCKPVVEDMQNTYSVLTNWVDARNKNTIRWLKWLGFTIEPAKPWGYLQLPFHRFQRLRAQ